MTMKDHETLRIVITMAETALKERKRIKPSLKAVKESKAIDQAWKIQQNLKYSQ
jgi:hypothetical protein